ncbi:ABC transporter ATP-binding protein [Rothia uropygialis]|uniref:ABC transporter ATP-binding protein n=1 Tax=Kocuria sp. 36 TaxID=1415402 RepID=UPI00101D2077|nr:ATP-binding cassette domain-containing protein [Kocuria sp. 36]
MAAPEMHHASDTSVLVSKVSLEYSTKRKRRFGKGPRPVVQALTGVSFSAKSGEFIGLVGRNGSGKSSLLRTIAGVEPPTSGSVYASSQPTLIGVHAALIGDLTGLENILLGCMAMGMTKQEATEARPSIENLAGLGPAISRPMNTYSSGMQARLRFAISRAGNPEILLIDEALSTGDASFEERSRRSMDAMLERAGTIFLVSHAAQTIEELCSRAIWLEEGTLVMDGPAEEVARRYRWFAHVLAQGDRSKAIEVLANAYQEQRRQFR